jgi:hypothetical protein
MQAAGLLTGLVLAGSLVLPTFSCHDRDHDGSPVAPDGQYGSVHVVVVNETDVSFWMVQLLPDYYYGPGTHVLSPVEVLPGRELEVFRQNYPTEGSFPISGPAGLVHAIVYYKLHRVPLDARAEETVKLRVTLNASRALQVTSDRPDTYQIVRVQNYTYP